MKPTSKSQLTKTIIYGTILGLVLVIYSFILHKTNLEKNMWLSLFQNIFLIAAIILSIQCFRNRFNEGYISYGKALGTGVLTIIWASLIVAIYTYLFTKYIDPTAIENARELALKNIENSNNEDQIELMSKIFNFIFSSSIMSVLTFIGNVFKGTIFSLIIAAFLKKEKDILTVNE